MKKDISTEIEIDAPADRVWRILTDFESFPSWNPFVVKVLGEPREGERLTIEVRLPNSRKIFFRPVILKAEPDRELRWMGTMPLGMFEGEHFYVIEPISENKVRFIHGEHFAGWLVPLIWAVSGKEIEKGYRLMNEALKKRAEQPI